MSWEQVALNPYERPAAQVCRAWALIESEAEDLLHSPERAHIGIGINALLENLYSPPPPAQWMTVPNKNLAIGGPPIRALARYFVVTSIGRVGAAGDNAVVESFSPCCRTTSPTCESGPTGATCASRTSLGLRRTITGTAGKTDSA